MEPALFDQVQSLLKARNAHATRHVQHAHHLKGLLHCGNCGSRMLLDFATNPRGTTYAYFVCSGRASKRTTCTRRAVPVQVAERLVEDSYANITISEDDYQHLAAEVDAAFDQRSASKDQEFADLTTNRARLEAESKLLATSSPPVSRRHRPAHAQTDQAAPPAGLAVVTEPSAYTTTTQAGGRAFQTSSGCGFLTPHHAYDHCTTGSRRLARTTRSHRIGNPPRTRHLRPSSQTVRDHRSQTDRRQGSRTGTPTSSDVACSRKTLWVVSKAPNLNTARRLERLDSAWDKGSSEVSVAPSVAPEPGSGVVSNPSRRNRTPLTEKEVEAIRTARAEGERVVSIAERFGIHRCTVLHYTKTAQSR